MHRVSVRWSLGTKGRNGFCASGRQCQGMTLTKPSWEKTREDWEGLQERCTRMGGETVKQKPNHQPGMQKESYSRYLLRDPEEKRSTARLKE